MSGARPEGIAAEPERVEAAVEYAQALALAGFGIVEAYAPTDAGGCTCRAGAECHSPGKHPVGDDWQKGATRSPATIAQIVRRRAGQYGVIPWPGERGLILDVDHADRLPVKLPPSLRVSSRPGRGHAYFRLPAGYAARQLPATAAWGEIRVEGASRHVIGPWSRHAAGTVYTPTGSPADIAELPADVLAQLFPPAQQTLAIAGPGYQLPDPGYAGSRYEAIRDYVASRYHHRLTEAELWAGVREVLAPRFAEPLPEVGPDSLRERFERAWHGTPAKLGPPAADGPANHSSGPDGPSERKSLPFLTGAQLAADTPAGWEYLWPPYIALGMIHEIDGKPKTAGKTTLLLHLIAAVLDGAPFLGERTMQSPVVLLTEQTRRSLAPTLRALGLDRDELLILTWPDAAGSSWAEIVAAAVGECLRTGARLLVIDTLTPFVGLGAEMENDAAAALAAMRPLQAAAQEHDLAILLARHDRKSGGEVAESGRGSNAWSGAVDCVIALRRQPNPVRPTIRELEAISRRGDVPEEPVLVELTEEGYIVLGDAGAVAHFEARDRVLECLSAQQDTTLGGLTLDELTAGVERPRVTVQRAVKALAEAGELVKAGKGRAGDPFRYSIAPGSARSAQRPLRSRGAVVGQTPDEPERPSLVSEAERIFADDLLPATPWDTSAVVAKPRADA